MRFLAPSTIVAALALLFSTLAPIAHAQSGLASIYSDTETAETASGERASDDGLTAAHRSLPFGTRVLVTNLTMADRSSFASMTVDHSFPAV